MQFFADALGLQRVLPSIERLQDLERARTSRPLVNTLPQARDPGVGVHGDQGVDAILGLDLDRPAALRAVAK